MITELSSSKCRLDLLEHLVETPLNSDELTDKVPYTASTVRRNLKILQEMGWLEKEGRTYRFREEKRFLVDPLLRTEGILRAYGEHRDHWESHDLSPIPEDLKEDFGMLRDGEVVSGTTAEPRRPLEREAELATGSETVKVLSPAYVPEYGEMAREWAETGAEVRVVSTQKAVNAFRRDNQEIVDKLREQGDVETRVVEGLLVGLTLGDDFVALNLPRNDGTFDLSRLFVARTEEAVEWGERLFRYYWDQSRPAEGP